MVLLACVVKVLHGQRFLCLISFIDVVLMLACLGLYTVYIVFITRFIICMLQLEKKNMHVDQLYKITDFFQTLTTEQLYQ